MICGANPFSVSRSASEKQSPFRMRSRFAGGWTVVAGALISAMVSYASHAGLGDPLMAAGGDIVMRFEGTSAGYESLISVNSVEVNGQSLFFPNFTTPIGSTINLGSFSAGLSLDIALHVITPSASNIWHTGAAALNLDNVIHANVTFDYNGESGRTFVGFEDQFGGGDLDYNDHTFSFTGVTAAVPEPGPRALMMVGMGTLAFVTRRRKAQQG